MATERKLRWNEFFMDSEGEFSFKRLLPAIMILLFVIYVGINLATGRTLDPNALDLITYVTITCIVGQTIEPFSRFRKTTIVSKDAVVTQEASPTAETAVNKAVEKMVESNTPPKERTKEETMPEMLE